jgi:hypothetical protein
MDCKVLTDKYCESAISKESAYLFSGLVVFVLLWSKLGIGLNLGVFVTTIPILAAFIWLGIISPPVAVVAYYMSLYLLGNVSIAYYPGISVLSLAAIVLVPSILIGRWVRGTLRFSNSHSYFWWFALGSMIIFLCIGFIQAFYSYKGEWLGVSGEKSIWLLLQVSSRNIDTLLQYSAVTHWAVFLLLGILAIRDYRDFNAFAFSFTILFAGLLAAFPIDFIATYVKNVFVECHTMGLSLQNINRSHIGYNAAIASVFAFVLMKNAGRRAKLALCLWWVVVSVVVVLAGSKGPVLAWLLATGYLFLRYRQEAIRCATALAAVIFVIALLCMFDRTLVPCGVLHQYLNSGHSFVSRADMFSQAMNDYKSSAHIGLFGGGFGAATRSVDPTTGSFILHAGSLNLFVDILLDTGVFGLALFIAGIGGALYCFMKATRARYDESVSYIRYAIIGMLIIVIVRANIAADTYGDDLTALTIGILLACGRLPKTSITNIKKM